MLSSVSSENRFTIRNSLQEAIFAASEFSTPKDRTCLGTSRPFTMHLLDRTHQEALTLHRRLSCSLLCCHLSTQRMEIWSPPGDYLGQVQESFSFTTNDFRVEGPSGELVFFIVGPNDQPCCFPKEAHFKVS